MRRVVVLLGLVTILWGEGPLTGGYAGAFTLIGADARSKALAGALVAEVNPGYLALTNPASLVYVQRREAGLSTITLPLDRSMHSLVLALGLPPSAAVGISYLRAGDDNIQGRSSIGEPTETLTYSENMLVLSFANSLSATLSIGLNTKLLFMNLEEEDSRGFGLDIGLFYHGPKGFNTALSVQNITGSYSWKVAASQGERNYVDYFPMIVSAGFRLPWRHFTFFGQTDAMIPKVKEEEQISYGQPEPVFRFAVEDLLLDRYYIRGGFEHLTPTLGAGLRYSLRQPYDSRVDYSLSLGKTGEGFGHFFSWVFSL